MTQVPAPSIRPARLEDAPAVAELIRQLNSLTEPPPMEERLKRLLARPMMHRVVVVPRPGGDGGALLGAVHASRRETIENDEYVEISSLIVDENARGAGVGKLLVAEAERWARELGLRVVRVRSNVVRERAHAFYQRLGYRVLKQQLAFIKEL